MPRDERKDKRDREQVEKGKAEHGGLERQGDRLLWVPGFSGGNRDHLDRKEAEKSNQNRGPRPAQAVR